VNDPFSPSNRRQPVPKLTPAEMLALEELASLGIEGDDDEGETT